MAKKGSVERELKNKTLLFSMWDCENPKKLYNMWYPCLENLFKELEVFDPKQKRLEFGSEIMKEKLFNIVREKKPDYFLFLTESNDLGIETIKKINEISPKTKTIIHLGDDDINFESRSRYYALFVDYCLVAQSHLISLYKKDGLKNAFDFLTPANTQIFKPMNVKKKYDITFVGQPLKPRIDMLRFLIRKGFKINVWGHGWEKYTEFSSVWGGALETDELVKVINQSKINLGFTKNQYGTPHFKGRFFEFGACNAFQLLDYFGAYKKYFKEDKEVVMFKDEGELLEKINYFLKHKDARERIAENTYKKIVKEFDLSSRFISVFGEILKKEKNFSRKLPSLKKKAYLMKEEYLRYGTKELEKRLNNYDFVYFSEGNDSIHREYLQSYALEKTGKDICCCGYFLFDKALGNYVKFNLYRSLEILKKDEFSKLLNINQLMVSKSFFLDNIENIYKVINGDAVDFINRNNTTFIKIPLVKIRKLSKINYEAVNKMSPDDLNRFFQMEFMFKLQSLMYRNRLFYSGYIYKLLINSLYNNKFILKYLIKTIAEKIKSSN